MKPHPIINKEFLITDWWGVSGDTSADSDPFEDVVFTNLIQASADGNSITKTGGAAYASNGDSNKKATSGDFSVKIIKNNQDIIFFGITTNDNNAGFSNINFAIQYSAGVDTYVVYENGVNVLNLETNYSPGQVLQISYESGSVNYYINSILKYTSLNPPSYGGDGAYFTVTHRDTGGSVGGCQISGNNLILA